MAVRSLDIDCRVFSTLSVLIAAYLSLLLLRGQEHQDYVSSSGEG
jgi:hypothetical protein